MQVYHLAFIRNADGHDIVVAAKNVAGHKSKGRVQEDPIVWNNCGQVVIPGGRLGSNEPPIDGGRREFLEETGVDLSKANVRAAMRCVGEAEARLLKDQKRIPFWCVYQQIDAASPLVRTVNENIKAGRVTDDELHDAGTAPASHAMEIFGVRRFDDGWRFQQFEVLVTPWVEQALERMYDQFDWFVIAAGKIPD